jgi:hypothetical protein
MDCQHVRYGSRAAGHRHGCSDAARMMSCVRTAKRTLRNPPVQRSAGAVVRAVCSSTGALLVTSRTLKLVFSLLVNCISRNASEKLYPRHTLHAKSRGRRAQKALIRISRASTGVPALITRGTAATPRNTSHSSADNQNPSANGGGQASSPNG